MASERSAPALFGPGCAAGLVLGALACVQMPALLLWLSAPMAVAGGAGWLLRWRGRPWAAIVLGRHGQHCTGIGRCTASCHPARRRRMCG